MIPAIPKEVSQLVIIPDGALGTVPFETLIYPSSDGEEYRDFRYLLSEYKISYDYSSTLFWEKNQTPPYYGDYNHQILLAAPINFAPSTGLGALAGTQEEVESLKYLFGGQNWVVNTKLNADASEAFVKQMDLTAFRYLHLATHGVVHESKPELSRIFLHPTEEEDGSLYSGEIYNLNISAELVTLSACETGLGKVAKGEGIVGLSRALLYAGADNLMVSLWPVADQSTSDLMIDFYQRHLFSENNDRFSGALRQAKLKMMRSENYQRPYFWAPFILVGK